jgi:hypothetical protein
MYLKPYNKNLYTLKYKDYYKVVVKANNYTLYLIAPSLQIEEERASKRT